MKTFLRNLITLNKRDYIGLACWLLISILVGLLSLPVMVGREIYQYKHYYLAKFEWEDIVRYTFVILLGSIINSLFFCLYLEDESYCRALLIAAELVSIYFLLFLRK